MAKLSKEVVIKQLVEKHKGNAEELSKKTAGELRQMLKDAEKKQAKAPKEKAKAKAPKEKAEKKQPEEPFVTLCGGEYDPAPKGTCETTCKNENKDEHGKCLEHFKLHAKPKKKAAPKKEVKPLNWLGHRIGSQADMTDMLLVEGATITEIAEQIGTTKGRVQNHINHLRAKKGIKVLNFKKNGLFYIEEAPDIEAYLS